MDSQKDNNTEPRQNRTPANIEKIADHISFFEKDCYFSFIYKKTEKLTGPLAKKQRPNLI